MGRGDPLGLPGAAVRHLKLPPKILPHRTGRPRTKDQGDLRDAGRLGCRRVHVLLRREGWQLNIRWTRRIYNELGLQLRNKHPKCQVKAKLCEDRREAVGPNQVRAVDFVPALLAPGKKLRILTVVDTRSRYCLAADPRFACRGEDVAQTLERVCRRVGYLGPGA